MFRILIRGRKCEKYIANCIQSLLAQEEKDFYAYILLDAPPEATVRAVGLLTAQYEHKIATIVHPKRIGLCHNLYCGLQCMREVADPEDIVAILDADDSFTADALEKVRDVYEETNCWATYGSFRNMSDGYHGKMCSRKAEWPPRKKRWAASHLKTFKAHLCEFIPERCFQDAKGNWLQAASDRALMYAVLELCGPGRVQKIEKPIYWYRNNYHGNTSRAAQKRADKILREKKGLK